MSEIPVSPPFPPQPPRKSGLPAIAWVGIGCGTLLVIAIIVTVFAVSWGVKKVKEFSANPEKAAAELLVKAHPELEKVRSDDARGEMTVRDSSGNETTYSYKDLAEGRFSFRDKDGNETRIDAGDLSQVPEWVPRVPGTSGESGAFHAETPNEISGLYNARSEQSAEELEEFFAAEAEKLGLTTSQRSSMAADGTNVLTLNYSGEGRHLGIVLTERPGEDILMGVSYSEKK